MAKRVTMVEEYMNEEVQFGGLWVKRRKVYRYLNKIGDKTCIGMAEVDRRHQQIKDWLAHPVIGPLLTTREQAHAAHLANCGADTLGSSEWEQTLQAFDDAERAFRTAAGLPLRAE